MGNHRCEIMKSETALTKKDVVIVLACAFFLLVNLGAIGAGGISA